MIKTSMSSAKSVEEGDDVVVYVVLGADADDEVGVRELLQVLHRQPVAGVAPEVVEEEADVGGGGQRVAAGGAGEEGGPRRARRHVVRRRVGLPVLGHVHVGPHVVVLGQNSISHRCMCPIIQKLT
uniref:Uncharacterized protein n=1 Tax=Oryza brachyantha TaxID=4533 RepID=J3MUN8_ORYBR